MFALFFLKVKDIFNKTGDLSQLNKDNLVDAIVETNEQLDETLH